MFVPVKTVAMPPHVPPHPTRREPVSRRLPLVKIPPDPEISPA